MYGTMVRSGGMSMATSRNDEIRCWNGYPTSAKALTDFIQTFEIKGAQLYLHQNLQ